jgi:hypothetical protein
MSGEITLVHKAILTLRSKTDTQVPARREVRTGKSEMDKTPTIKRLEIGAFQGTEESPCC